MTVEGPAALAALSPRVIAGRYEIRGLLGTGGMGSVYRAFDRELEEPVALKVIRRDLLKQPEMLERFRKEVKLARRVTHRNVARVFDIGEAAGERYFTMELVVGRDFWTVLEGGPLPVGEVIRIGRELADALAAAHAVGVVHRDLKPDNVILADDGRVVITDFGIARALEQPASQLTLSGNWLGTPQYMAPELVAGQGPADEKCDLFALGVILFEVLTGRSPWEGEGLAAVTARLQRDAPDPSALRAEVPPALAELIRSCLARSPAQRPASASQVATALAACQPLTSDTSLRATIPLIETPAWSADSPPRALVSPTSRVRAVAVLPFGEPGVREGSYLSDGLTEALIEALARSPALGVRPRGMVMPLRNSPLDATALGRHLGVEALVCGIVSRHEGNLEISVQVVDATEGFTVWVGEVRSRSDDLFRAVDEIAARVASALSTHRPATRPQGSPDAEGLAELLLRARHAYHSFWQGGTARAVELFERALELSPTDPRALAGHALACLREGFFTGAGLDRVRATIERARAAVPELAELHLAQASISVQENEPVAAVRELRRALMLAPDLAEASWLLGRLLLEADAIELAIKRLDWALAIEPALSVARRDRARAAALLGRWDDVERLASEEIPGREVGPWLDRARFAMWQRDRTLARQHLADFPPLGPADESGSGPWRVAHAMLEMVALGRSPFHERAFHDFMRMAQGTRRRGAFASQIEAEIQAFLGAEGEALRAIGDAVQAGLTDLAWLEHCPLFATLRDEPAFVRARVEVGRVAAPVRDAILGS